MCGIFGCVGKIEQEQAKQCIKRIEHRGPDALQVKMLEGATLAHARLSIMDVSEAASQPFSDKTGRYWIAFNGEIYNFIELRNELIKKGYAFRTDSDTEVVLYAFIEWGGAFQEKCNGMWALAIWDNHEHELFLSRDRFGIKPLFLYKRGRNLYFGSEMKAFFPIMNERKPNYSLFDTMDFSSYESTRECTIAGIDRFPAGTCAVYSENEYTEKRWWNTIDHLLQTPDEYDEQVECLRELFLDACKIRMRSDVSIGTALSGGIDSSAVVGGMHHISKSMSERMNPDWQNAFVADLPGTNLDETMYAELAAQSAGIPIEKVKINPLIGDKQLLQYLYMVEEPYNTCPIPFIQTYKAVRNKGIKVTLDGHGADEIFGGYSFDLISALYDANGDDEKAQELLETYNECTISENRLSKDDFLGWCEKDKEYISYCEKLSGTEKLDFLNRKLYWETHRNILPSILRCYDRYSMANGLEIRMPFMDYRIVCFAFSIPWTSKVRNGFTKSIVRDMAKPFMSDKILSRKSKIGFASPMTEWFRGPLKEFLLDTIHSDGFKQCSLINGLEVSIIVNEFLKNDDMTYSAGAHVWNKIVPYLWKKAVIDCE